MVSGQNLTDPNQEVTGSFAPMFPKGSDGVAECFHRGKRFPEGSPPNSCFDFYTQYEGSCSIHVYKRWIQLLGLRNYLMHSF